MMLQHIHPQKSSSLMTDCNQNNKVKGKVTHCQRLETFSVKVKINIPMRSAVFLVTTATERESDEEVVPLSRGA